MRRLASLSLEMRFRSTSTSRLSSSGLFICLPPSDSEAKPGFQRRRTSAQWRNQLELRRTCRVE